MNIRLFIILIILSLASCKTVTNHKKIQLVTKPQFLDETILGEPIPIISVEEVFSLNSIQKKNFLESYQNNNSLHPSRRVFEYLQEHLKNFNYYSDTLTATESLAQNSGNCLSLAILTKSLVDIAGLGIRYELVKTIPVFQKTNDILLKSQHIRAVLYDTKIVKGHIPGKFKNSTKIDYFPSKGTQTLRWVDENEFFSLYYINKAAEALTLDKTIMAFWYVKKALELKPSNVHAVSMMGVIHNRLGYPEYAENWYLYGLSFDKDEFEILHNYYSLLIRLGRNKEANEIAIRLEKYDTNNPFDWISLGDDAFSGNNYKLAIKLYKKAVNMANYLHEPYAGIARSEYMLGNPKGAKRAIKKALENTHKQEFLTVYQAKYELFNKKINK
jgi:tetratricopeptide (TPR) repeat protein